MGFLSGCSYSLPEITGVNLKSIKSMTICLNTPLNEEDMS